ncbi:MAG: hypothetical protein R3248_07880 [Candidatus Promineifilaceae bacterium]|nr:hypothetical protein [Candidatus Promineifilaceae bacterium]
MSLLCPACENRTLEIESFLEMPPDNHSDEITVQIIGCSRCDFTGVAVYEESRRGALGREAVDHAGYYADEEDVQRLREALAACPAPADPRCDCAVHRKFGRQDVAGRWRGLESISLGERFAIQI